MDILRAQIARHPLRKKPYNAIRFAGLSVHGTPLYKVKADGREVAAATALKVAFEAYGGHCFHCKKWMPAQTLSHDCGRDHVRPRSQGGPDYLHNLVLACGSCNRAKGSNSIIAFRIERGDEYLNVLADHISACIKTLATGGGEMAGSTPREKKEQPDNPFF